MQLTIVVVDEQAGGKKVLLYWALPWQTGWKWGLHLYTFLSLALHVLFLGLAW